MIFFCSFFAGDLGRLKSRKQWLWGPTPHFLLVVAPPNPFDRMVKTMRLRTKVLIVSDRLPIVSVSVSKTKKGSSNSKLYTDDPANHVAKFTDKQKADASFSCETSVFFVCVCSQSRHSCHQKLEAHTVRSRMISSCDQRGLGTLSPTSKSRVSTHGHCLPLVSAIDWTVKIVTKF